MADDDDSNMIGSSFSLVRYNNPVLIDKHSDTPSPAPGAGTGKPGKDGKGGDEGGGQKGRPKSAADTTSDAASIAAKQRSETEEILDSILPPREWEENGQLWRQSVSSTPATRLDVINLQVGQGFEAQLRLKVSNLFLAPPSTTISSHFRKKGCSLRQP